MKKAVVVLVYVLVLSFGTCFAFNFGTNEFISESGNTYSGEKIDKSIFDEAIDNIDNLAQDKEMNIMKFGEIVTAEGYAKDLLILAGLTINQEAIGDYAFIAGQNLNVSGEINKDAFLAGSTSVNINGNISRDAYVVGSNIIISGKIGRDAYLFGSDILITESAVIEGNIIMDAGSIQIDDGATITGTVTYKNDVPTVSIPDYILTKVIESPLIETHNDTFKSSLLNCVMWLVSNIILFAITMLIAPKLFEKIKASYNEKGGGIILSTLGFGILLLIIIPIIAIFAMFTIIGCSLGIIGLLLYFIIMIYSTVLTGYLIGSILFKDSDINKYLVGIIGITIIQILRMLPFIGGWVSFISFLISFGLIVEVTKKQNKAE